MKVQPPKRALRFLRWFCREDYLEELEGDLAELFEQRYKESPAKARRSFLLSVIHYFRPGFIKAIYKVNYSNTTAMFKYNFKIAWRSLSKQKMYTIINIGGYAISITTCLIIGLFIRDELSHDQHYADGDRVFRIVASYEEPGNSWKGVTLPAPIKNQLESDFPEIEQAGRLVLFDFALAGNNQFRPLKQNQSTYEEGFVYGDPEILEILEIPLVYGQRSKALTEPNTMVISRKKADRYFPGQNPVGQIVFLNENESQPYKIAGVMENFPSSSHLQCDFLLTLSKKEFWPGSQASWGSNLYDSYIKLKKGSDPDNLEAKLKSIKNNYIVRHAERTNDPRIEEIRKYFSFQLQPVKEIYLSTEVLDNNISHGNIKVIRLFAIVACFILLLACINFINLSTAKSSRRAKEVGLRKVVGSYRRELITQFITESWVISGLSFIIGVILAWVFLPYFNEFSGKSLVFPWSEWWLPALSLPFIVLVGTLAGIYPALYLSAFKPVDVLRGNLSKGSGRAWLRSGLVVFQFATSIVLIMSTFIIYRQVDFILNTDIGYEKDQVIMLQGANTLGEKRSTLKNELLRLPEVLQVTQSSYLPISGTQRNGTEFWLEGHSKTDVGVPSQVWSVDQDYFNTLGMQLTEGRSFSTKRASDSTAIIINQALAKKLGLEAPVGKRISFWNSSTYHIIGVLSDFYFRSIKDEVEPLALTFGQGGSIVAVKVNSENMSQTIAAISSLWKALMPVQPIRYSFLDDSYARMYKDVKRTGKMFTAFALLAIAVACSGLFALSAYMVEQKSKEVGIRKVLGASFGSIFNLLTFKFLRLVLIAISIATPLGWYTMNKWLNNYANRVDMTWDTFIIPGISGLLIALLTVSFESIKAGFVNPSSTLRSD